jgi:hypothetical protein
MPSGIVNFLQRYIKAKGIESAVLQLLNLVVPLAPLLLEGGYDIMTDILIPLLKTNGIDSDVE